ncbi:hypothetical protein BKA62DRAFT_767707 [Auriculariales sp. MPI-PUGE-AT-0066]|nr:hypothetical protein BKA62DRAFT_767707 [Auriculariales sp. MPI-PUGE-AT-0066]
MFRLITTVFALALSVSAAALPTVDSRGIFDATRTISSSRVVNTTVDAALAAVKDPKTLITLSPLVTGVKQDASDSSLYHITDMINILGIKIPTEYTAKFTFYDDGVDSDTNASGVHLINKWRVKSTPEGTQVSEEANLETNVLLVSFVEEQIRTSHGQLLDAMAGLLNKQQA